MDIARPPAPRRAPYGRIAVGVGLVGFVVLAIRGLGSTGPSVDAAGLVIDTVRQGDLVREVRGTGTLVPEHLRLITALASARVERVAVQSGVEVAAGQVLVEMSNPDVQLQAMLAEQEVNRARVDLLELRVALRGAILAQRTAVAQARTAQVRATQEAGAADTLFRQRMISRFDAANRAAEADEAAIRLAGEQERLMLMEQAVDSQLAARREQIGSLERIARTQRDRQSGLSVRSPEAGVLQDLTVQPGQWVPEGSTLAKVVRPGALKAVVRVPESLARDVNVGQEAVVDTRNGLVPGRVARKDPAAVQGSIAIDLALPQPLPRGAVPDLGIDGTIRIERLANVLHMARPGGTVTGGRLSLFRLSPDGRRAERVAVVVGRGSAARVEVLGGLRAGDRVILSDMSRFDAADQVRVARP